ncbi:plasmid pRiA4b ORF-3 family protein [Pseudofrankia sp. DC12]|uniref:plasmid pRiA4b ORF-3 family protein n=1 Tax=Pseudofrankia sp. DC12 TaxID=683315 RepID=UPI0012FA633B|nr:plasmid pRiA4b ORF-3 family protein [Pseudofrankia sp. DC12]
MTKTLDSAAALDDPDTLARAAESCLLFIRGRGLAAWAGAGRPVTPAGAPRPADLAAVCAAAGVALPPTSRRAIDIRDLQQAWTAARAAGLLVVEGRQARAADDGPAEPGDGEQPGRDVLGRWVAVFDEVCLNAARPSEPRGPREACVSLLSAVAEAAVDETDARGSFREQARSAGSWISSDTFRRWDDPYDGARDILAVLGALDAADGQVRITPLGRWLRTITQRARPTRGMPAEAVVPLLAAAKSPEDVAAVLTEWLPDRFGLRGDPADRVPALTELLRAAAGAGPAVRQRLVDAGLPELLPALRALRDVPALAPHLAEVLFAYDAGPPPDERTSRWLAAESALATLATDGAQAAADELVIQGGVEATLGGGHPDEAELRDAVAAFVAAGGAPRRFQLKVELTVLSPAPWRRVTVPAAITLGDLHDVLQVLFGWDDDHLHAFRTASGDVYGDPEDADSEYHVTLYQVVPKKGAKLTYIYDFGDTWRHTITLEAVGTYDGADVTAGTELAPVCTGGHGDAPVEDWNEDCDGDDSVPFDQDAINTRLAKVLTGHRDDEDGTWDEIAVPLPADAG